MSQFDRWIRLSLRLAAAGLFAFAVASAGQSNASGHLESERTTGKGDQAADHDEGSGEAKSPAQLAAELDKHIRVLRDGAKDRRDRDEGMPKRNYQIYETLRRLQPRTSALAKRLGEGETADQTDKLFGRIQRLVTDIQVYTQGYPARDEMQPHIDSTLRALSGLAAYYHVPDLPPVAGSEEE